MVQKAEKLHREVKAHQEKLEFDKRRKNEVAVGVWLSCELYICKTN